MATAPTATLLKAKLTAYAPQAGGGSSTPLFTVDFPFNPKEWSVTYTADWTVETAKKHPPPPEFKGPKPASVTVEIFLDETHKADGDVSRTVLDLQRLVATDPDSLRKEEPSAPHVYFQWGRAISFFGYVESVAVSYTLFRGDGTPIRGTAKVAMKELPSATPPRQNPTSGGEAGARTHRVVDGDSLASIAYAEYRDATAWRGLAEANGLDDPLSLRPGTLLRVPPR